MFMPSLNNYNTKSQMALDIPLCRTNKGQKSMSFLRPKTWNKLEHKLLLLLLFLSLFLFFLSLS